jgi:hypothetical protein
MIFGAAVFFIITRTACQEHVILLQTNVQITWWVVVGSNNQINMNY